jgi:hypothetical protein
VSLGLTRANTRCTPKTSDCSKEGFIGIFCWYNGPLVEPWVGAPEYSQEEPCPNRCYVSSATTLLAILLYRSCFDCRILQFVLLHRLLCYQLQFVLVYVGDKDLVSLVDVILESN